VAFAFEQPVVDGRRAAQLATMTGTHVGGFLGLPPSGRRFQVPVVFLYTFADGRVIDERRVYDFTGMLMQVGVLKAKPA
jgi:predicted ester cyclase